MSIVPASSLSGSELLSLGNNVLPAVVRDRLERRVTGTTPSRCSRRRRTWWRRHRRAGAAAA